MADVLRDRHLVLVGMMGAGKSTVGRALAAVLGRPFLDTDVEIESRERRSIDEIFRADGEAHFREVEAEMIRTCVEREPSVIATGGGALLPRESRRLLKERGYLVWLNADVETLLARTRAAEGIRPLLSDGDAEQRLAALLAERAVWYGEADITIETSGRTGDEVTGLILDRIRGGMGRQEEQ